VAVVSQFTVRLMVVECVKLEVDPVTVTVDVLASVPDVPGCALQPTTVSKSRSVKAPRITLFL
jgi:hypothetical protein